MDVACGGKRRQKPRDPKVMTTNECQTDPTDFGFYFDTEEELQRQNVTVLTGRPRDIQEGIVRRESQNSVLSIVQQGSSTSIGSQVVVPKPKPEARGIQLIGERIHEFVSKLKDLFLGRLDTMRIFVEKSSSESEEDETGSSEDGREERDHEWLESTSSEESRDNTEIARKQLLLENPP